MSATGSVMSSPSTRTVKKPGDRAVLGVAGPFEQAWQEREDGRRIAAQSRRLPCPEPDLALCHRQPRDRVHHEQHVLAFVAERLGNGRGDLGGLQSEQSRLVGRGDYHARPSQPLRAELLIDELLNLAAPFADESDHVDVR